MTEAKKETTMEGEVLDTMTATTGLVRRAARDVVLMPVMDVKLARQRLEELQEFCANYLQESTDGGTDGGDYGIIPGTSKKKVLFKSGSEKLCDVYGLADRYTIISKVEDFDHGLFDYTIECVLVRKTDEMFVGSGLGSCSTWESKYRWRESQRTCPACGAAAIIKGKAEYGGGWLCWAKKGGCGSKYADTDPAIVGQQGGRIENPDIIDAKNTVLKIAKKRAKIDAVIGVTRSSGIFTQDLDEHELADEPTAVSAAPASGNSGNGTSPTGKEETHAERIARVKREQQKKSGPVQSAAPAVPAVDAAAAALAPAAAAPAAPKAVPVEAVDGKVQIATINVRNGPMVMKDGKSQPSWGPLYVIGFTAKVKTSDGAWVTDAVTDKEALATAAEDARDASKADPTQGFLTPLIDPGSKKGSFRLMGFTETTL